MPLDARQQLAENGRGDAHGRLASRVGDLERDVAELQRAVKIQAGTAAPAGVAREGTPYAQNANPNYFIWLYIGGAWRKVAVA